MVLSSAFMVVDLVAEGVGVAKELVELAHKAKQGHVITDEEIKQARKDINNAVDEWDKTMEKDNA